MKEEFKQLGSEYWQKNSGDSYRHRLFVQCHAWVLIHFRQWLGDTIRIHWTGNWSSGCWLPRRPSKTLGVILQGNQVLGVVKLTSTSKRTSKEVVPSPNIKYYMENITKSHTKPRFLQSFFKGMDKFEHSTCGSSSGLHTVTVFDTVICRIVWHRPHKYRCVLLWAWLQLKDLQWKLYSQ